MTEKDKKIQDLKREIEKLKEQKEYILNVIDEECIWDEHEWGYINDFSKSKVRTLMMEFNKREPLEIKTGDNNE